MKPRKKECRCRGYLPTYLFWYSITMNCLRIFVRSSGFLVGSWNFQLGSVCVYIQNDLFFARIMEFLEWEVLPPVSWVQFLPPFFPIQLWVVTIWLNITTPIRTETMPKHFWFYTKINWVIFNTQKSLYALVCCAALCCVEFSDMMFVQNYFPYLYFM